MGFCKDCEKPINLCDCERGFPHTCKKCGHEYADVVDLRSFYSDESNIHLFRCKKCNHVSRE